MHSPSGCSHGRTLTFSHIHTYALPHTLSHPHSLPSIPILLPSSGPHFPLGTCMVMACTAAADQHTPTKASCQLQQQQRRYSAGRRPAAGAGSRHGSLRWFCRPAYREPGQSHGFENNVVIACLPCSKGAVGNCPRAKQHWKFAPERTRVRGNRRMTCSLCWGMLTALTWFPGCLQPEPPACTTALASSLADK